MGKFAWLYHFVFKKFNELLVYGRIMWKHKVGILLIFNGIVKLFWIYELRLHANVVVCKATLLRMGAPTI